MKKNILMFVITLFFVFISSSYPMFLHYPDVDEVRDFLFDLEERFPEIAKVESLGYSCLDSLPIWGIKISDNVHLDENEPSIFVNGAIHAEEMFGALVCLSFAETLLTSYGVNDSLTFLVNELTTWIVPVVNPEGLMVVIEGLDTVYRKNKRDNNENGIFNFVPGSGNDTDGVDLNRNFPLNWDGEESSPYWYSTTYRGPFPASEPEVMAMMRLCERERFLSAVWYHSSRTGALNEFVIYPWRWGGYSCPDYGSIASVALDYSRQLVRHNRNPYQQRFNQQRAGNAMDWQYATYGTFAFMVETDTTCNPSIDMLPQAISNQLNGLFWLMRRSFGSGIAVTVRDIFTDTPLVAEIEIVEASDTILSPRLTDSVYGTHFRLLQYGDYTLKIRVDGFHEKTLPVTVLNGVRFDTTIYMRPESIDETLPISDDFPLLYPNPFNKGSELSFSLSENQYVTIDLIDIRGNLLKTIHTGSLERGRHIIPVSCKECSSGLYLLRINTLHKTETLKMFLMK